MAELLLDTATSLMGAGSHTSRIVRGISRMAESYGYEVFVTIFQKNMTMMVRKKGCAESITLVRSTKHIPLNFRIVAELSTMSWDMHDHGLTIEQAREKYEQIMSAPRMDRWIVLLLVAAANASFCKLFNGDWIAVVLVFCSTLVAFLIRQEMMLRKINHSVVFIIAAFVASFIAGMAQHFELGTTPDIAMATSVLFLIPGVPLINSIMDIMEGHVLTGISRAVNASVLIISLTIGFMASLLILGLDNF